MALNPELPFEGNLSQVTDDEYFDAVAAMPAVYDADGNELVDLHADVVDARPAKAQVEAAGGTWKPEDFL